MELNPYMELQPDTASPEIVIDEEGRHYHLLEDGYVNFKDVSHHFFPTGDIKYRIWDITGEVSGHPKLGQGLRFSGLEDRYYNVGIHPEDLGEFVQRRAAWDAHHLRFVEHEDERIPLNEATMKALHGYLESIDAFNTQP